MLLTTKQLTVVSIILLTAFVVGIALILLYQIYVDWQALVDFLLYNIPSFGVVITVFLLWQQHTLKNRIASIDYCKDLLNKIRDDDELHKTNNAINNNQANNCTDHEIDVFLNEYDDLALFWKQKVVQFNHLEQMHGAILKKIKSTTKTKEYIDKEYKKSEFFFYSNLVKLLEKID